MTSGWIARLSDGRELRRDGLPAGASYFDCVPRELVTEFAVVAGGRVLWRAREAPLAYRRRTQMAQSLGRSRVVHVVIFAARIVWVFETGRIVVGPTFGDAEPFRKIKPTSDAESAALAMHFQGVAI